MDKSFALACAASLLCVCGTAHGLVRGDDEPVLEASAMEEAAEGPNSDRPRLPAPPITSKQEAEAPQTPDESAHLNNGRIHLTAGLDLTNAYFSRGLRQEDRGFIAQPWATIGVDLLRDDEFSLAGSFGSWNSYHTTGTAASSGDEFEQNVYESDYTFGLTAETGAATFGMLYGWFSSPSGAFTTVEEFQLTFSYDDSELLKEWSLSPNALFVLETGQGTSDGGRKGAYLQLGVAPGFDFENSMTDPIAISFPVNVGLSLSNYYEDASGDDDFLGFASAGVRADIPIPAAKDYGAWTLSLSGSVLFLGDMAATVNGDDDVQFVGTFGLSVEY